jgi:hypothetical protein
MNYQKFRSIHNYSSLFIPALIFFALSDNMGSNLKWSFIITIYFIIHYIGRLLYVFFLGVLIHQIKFLDTVDDMQIFVMCYQFGLTEMDFIFGKFDNRMDLSEQNLEVIMYGQSTRKMLENFKKYGEKTEIIFNYHGDNVPVIFIRQDEYHNSIRQRDL